MVERQTEMYVISINSAGEEDKRGVAKRTGEGLLDYLGYKCQRTWKRESCIKYAAVQIRLPEGGRTQSHFLPLFQNVNHPRAVAASLFCQLILTFLPAPIWHFLLAISLLPNFLQTYFPRKSLASLLLGTCLILAASSCHITVLSFSK